MFGLDTPTLSIIATAGDRLTLDGERVLHELLRYVLAELHSARGNAVAQSHLDIYQPSMNALVKSQWNFQASLFEKSHWISRTTGDSVTVDRSTYQS